MDELNIWITYHKGGGYSAKRGLDNEENDKLSNEKDQQTLGDCILYYSTYNSNSNSIPAVQDAHVLILKWFIEMIGL